MTASVTSATSNAVRTRQFKHPAAVGDVDVAGAAHRHPLGDVDVDLEALNPRG